MVWQGQLTQVKHYYDELTLPVGSPIVFLTLQADGKTLTRKIVRQ